MKNSFRLFGTIAILAIIGFSFVSCDSDSGSEKVIITISNLPVEYNNFWAYAETNDDVFFAAESATWNATNADWSTEIITCSKISNGSVTMNVYSNNGTMPSGSMVFKVGIINVQKFSDDSDFSAIFEFYRDTGLTVTFNGTHGTGIW